MNKLWIVTAESSRARIFSAPSLQGALTELEGLTHPEGRMHARDLVSEQAGRTNDSFGIRHNFGTDYDPKEHEAQHFAKEIATRLEEARVAGKFEELVLVAPPEFLGQLRAALSEVTRHKVVKSIHKNLVQADPEAIRKHLFD
jgi:protein required for attachment to host cells